MQFVKALRASIGKDLGMQQEQERTQGDQADHAICRSRQMRPPAVRKSKNRLSARCRDGCEHTCWLCSPSCTCCKRSAILALRPSWAENMSAHSVFICCLSSLMTRTDARASSRSDKAFESEMPCSLSSTRNTFTVFLHQRTLDYAKRHQHKPMHLHQSTMQIGLEGWVYHSLRNCADNLFYTASQKLVQFLISRVAKIADMQHRSLSATFPQ
jgi:hypothetical protein